MPSVKEVKDNLKLADKTSISFSIPVLERIKLECLSFLGDDDIPSPNGKDVVVGAVRYPLGVKNSYHHLSIGRALYKLIRLNPAVGNIVDEKKLSVRLIGEEVVRLARFYKDASYINAKEKGYGFDSLNFHRVPDEMVDVNVLIEAVVFMKPAANESTDSIEIYSQDETTRKLRKELAVLEAAAEAEKKAKAAAKKVDVKLNSPAVATGSAPVKPNRTDSKYDGLFGDTEFEMDMQKYNQEIASKLTTVPEEVPDVDLDEDASIEDEIEAA